MEELKMLLRNYIILRTEQQDNYYRIKDKYKEFKSFITDNLGYSLIIRSDFIRLEKIPGKAESFMGISEFENTIEYVMLMLMLIFLEDKGKEEQFLLSHITEALSSNDIDVKFEWTEYSTRRSLIKVLKFMIKNNIIKITDGSEDDFALDESKEVLFESTGVSKYLVNNFNDDILDFKSSKELFVEKSLDSDIDKGAIRKNRVYRKLLLSPIVYRDESLEDYEYIKNYRKYIEENFSKYLGWSLHVHKNGAMLVLGEREAGFSLFPNTKGISDVILFVLNEIRNKVKNEDIKINEEDIAILNKSDFEEILLRVKLNKSNGFSKEFREMSDKKYIYEIEKEMESFKFISKEKEFIKILPLCGKVIGEYPADYDFGGKNEE